MDFLVRIQFLNIEIQCALTDMFICADFLDMVIDQFEITPQETLVLARRGE